ncbi:MAG TPA: hypothetical protein IAA98_12995 [Candidatus Avipropionibacterium avicola]|uniref:Uncharacterized protein n=1 Tax=Candidatus Avipropionibacterium avicola TaxID=2840701 RepID=A0A9D1H1Q7_9ACTN|nr:hypothetical protein [Candidatus Avipropionibacterium avicola]
MTEAGLPEIQSWDDMLSGTRTLSNRSLSLTYLPGRGGSITGLRRIGDDTPILWQAPWGIVPIGATRPPATASVTAHEMWAGGWRTLYPSSGRAITLYGADMGYDGEACVAPYRVEEQAPDSVRLRTRLVRTPVEVIRTITLSDPEDESGAATVRVVETVRNVGQQAVEMMWANEIVLGEPLVGPTTTVDTGASVVRPEPDTTHSVSYDDLMPWPRSQGKGEMINLRRVPAKDAATSWQAYLSDFSEPQAEITNHAAGLRVRLTWDGETMPYLWYQMEAGGRQDFPHYSGSYYLGLSPASAWPRQGLNDARRISSTAQWLGAGEELTTWIELAVSDPRSPEEIAAADQA